ncbi:MAG: hypothetical protein HEQ39_12900 [Rhizobacter sp.]
MKGPTGIGENTYLLADASAIGMGWSKPSAGASDGKVKSYLGQVLNSLTGGKIDSIERLVYFDGKRRAQLEASLNKEVVSASGGRLSDWRQLLSASGREALQRQTASSNPPANKPAPSNAPWKIGGVDVGAGARQVWNGVKNVPNPLLGGLTPNQAGQVLKGGYNATVRTGNQVLGGPVFPVAEPASSFASVRARADALVARASKGKFDSVADLVHFGGDNKAANRLRGQVTQMLQKDAGAQAGGFSNWKQVLTAAERGQLERTLDNIQNDTPARPLQPKEGNLISGINRNVNQILAPFNASLPTQQDNSLQAMRGGANFVLDKAGLPKLQELAKIPFDDPRRVKADQVLGQYLHSNNLYGALAKLPSGKTERIDHWTDLFAPSELNRFVGGMEKALLPKAVALSGVNDPEGRTMQVPKDEAFKQIGEIKQKVQDYFGGAWPDAAKPLLGTLDALQGYTMDRQVDALRTKLTQSGRPIDKLVSMGIGFVRVANPAAVIGNLIKLDQEIARTNSTKPLEQALSAIGMQFKDVAGVGKDLAVLLARGDKKGAEALLKKNYDLSTVEGQDRATAAINTLLTVYGGAKLTQAGLKKLGIFKDPNASALVPVKQTPSQVGTVGRLAPALEQLKSLTAQVDDAIQSNNLGRLQQLKAQMTGLLGEARKLGRGSGDIRSGDFKAVNIAAEQALVRIDGALKVKVPATPPVSTNTPVNKPVVSTPPEVKTPIVPPTTASTPPVKLEPVLGNVPVQPAVDTSGVRQYQLHPGPIGSVPISQSGRGDVVPKSSNPVVTPEDDHPWGLGIGKWLDAEHRHTPPRQSQQPATDNQGGGDNGNVPPNKPPTKTSGTPPDDDSSISPNQRPPNTPLSADERAYLKDILSSTTRAERYLSGQHGHNSRESAIAQRMVPPLSADEQQSVMAYLTHPVLRTRFFDGSNLGPRMTGLRERVLQLPREQVVQPQVKSAGTMNTTSAAVKPGELNPPGPLSLVDKGADRVRTSLAGTQAKGVNQDIASPQNLTQTIDTNAYANISAALSTFRAKLEQVKQIGDLDRAVSRTESIGNTGLLQNKRFDTSPSAGFTPQDRRLLDQTLRNPKTREQFISGLGLSDPLLTLRARLQQQLIDPALVQQVYPQGLPRGVMVQDNSIIKPPGNRDQASLPGSVARQETLENFKTGAKSILNYEHFPLVQHPTLPGQTTNTAGSQATEHYLRAAYKNMPLWSDFANRPFAVPTQQYPTSFRRQGEIDKQFEAWFQISESNAAGSTGKVATAAVSIPTKPRKGENTLEQAWAGEIPLSEATKPKPTHDKFYLSKVGAGGLPGGGNRIMDFAENTLRDEYGAPFIWGHAYQGRPNSRSVYSPLSNGANDAADVTLVDKRFDSPVLKLEAAEKRLGKGADALSRALELVTGAGNVPPSPQALKTALQDAAVGVQGGINMMDAAPRKPRPTRDSLVQLLGQIQARIPSGDVTAPLDITEWRGFLQGAQQQLAKASKEVRAAIGQEGERFGVDQRPTPDELERLRRSPDPDGFYTRRGYTAQLTGINPQSGAAGFHIHKWLNEGVPAVEPPLSWGQVLDDVKVGMQQLPSDLQQAAKDTVQAPVNWVKDRINDTRRDWEIFKTVTAPAAPGEQSLSPLQMGWEIARDAALQYGKKIPGPDLSGTFKPPVGVQPDAVGPQLVNPIVTGIRYSFDASAKVAQWTFKNVVPWLAYASANAALMGDFKILPNDRSSRRIFNVEPEAQTITIKGGDQLGLPFNILLGQNPGDQAIIKTPIGKEGNVATPYAVSIPATGTVGAYSGFVAVPPSPLPGLLPSRIFGGVEWGRADLGFGAGAGFSLNPLGTLRANPLAVTNTPNVGTALRSTAVLTLPNAQGSYWVDVGPVRVVGGRFITNASPFLDASTQPGSWEFNNRFGMVNVGAGRSAGGWNITPTGSMLTINTGYDAEAAQIFWTEQMRELMEFLKDRTKPFNTAPPAPDSGKGPKK